MNSLFSIDATDAATRAAKHADRIGVYIHHRLADAQADAKRLAAEKPRSPLHGVPFGLKDEFETLCLPTTGGSFRHRNRRSLANSAVYEVFTDAGAILFGKSNLSDLGLAPEATNYVSTPAQNPFDKTRTAGGSSGGSALAVAHGFHGFDWGTDIGGSIRLPAAFCGIYGLRLSDETWPITDLFPSVPLALAWMCGQGPFTKTLDQMRAVLQVARPRLRTGLGRPFSFRGFAIYPPDAGDWPTFPSDVERHLRSLDVEVKRENTLPPPRKIRRIYDAVWCAHFLDLLASDPSISLPEGIRAIASSLLFRGRFGDRRFHPTTAELLLLIAIGRVALYRNKETVLRRAETIRHQFHALWDAGFVVVAPVTSIAPPKIGETNRNRALLNCTVPGNIADATGLAIPFGTFDGHLPRAVQFMGPPGSENLLIDLAERLASSRDADPSLRLAMPALL